MSLSGLMKEYEKLAKAADSLAPELEIEITKDTPISAVADAAEKLSAIYGVLDDKIYNITERMKSEVESSKTTTQEMEDLYSYMNLYPEALQTARDGIENFTEMLREWFGEETLIGEVDQYISKMEEGYSELQRFIKSAPKLSSS